MADNRIKKKDPKKAIVATSDGPIEVTTYPCVACDTTMMEAPDATCAACLTGLTVMPREPEPGPVPPPGRGRRQGMRS